MLNQMVKWTVILGLWRKYKRHVSVTLFLLLALILITLFHQDFVEFNEKSATPYLGWSYAVKWFSYLACILLYVFVIKKINKTANFDSTLHSMMSQKTSNKNATGKGDPRKAENIESQNSSDPFAHLRNKKSLRSKADFIIDNDQGNKR